MTESDSESPSRQGETEIVSLAAVRTREVSFYDDSLLAVQAVDDAVYVPVRRLCANLGLQTNGQVRRIEDSDVLVEGLRRIAVETQGGAQETLSLRADLIPLWLAGVNTRRIKDDAIRQKIVLYQKECATILWQAFSSQAGVDATGSRAAITQHDTETDLDFSVSQTDLDALKQLHENTLALARMQAEQIAIQERLNRAAAIVGRIRHQIDDHEERISRLEIRLDPREYITTEMAASISMKVKQLAEELTRREKGGAVHYNTVFAALGRHFHVASYREIRIDQFLPALAYLDDLLRAVRDQEKLPAEAEVVQIDRPTERDRG